MSTILLVEDNPHIRKINTQVLTQRGYDLLQTDTVAGCRELMRWNPVDLVVLDIMLPDGSGLELCREIKSRFHIPVLFLTALGENKEIVEGLRAGGDDYLTKPYDLEVLVARVEARLRSHAESRRYVCYGCLRLDTVSLCGYLGDRDMLLTQKEFAVLLILARSAGREVDSSQLRQVWGDDADGDNQALWTLISRLRKKLNSEESRLEILSRRGGGYLLEQFLQKTIY